MRKLLITCLLASTISFLSTAQEILPAFPAQNTFVYTFGDESFIHDEPYGDIIGTLPAGLELQVIGIVDMSEVRGKMDIWYEVTFYFQNRNRYGLIPIRHIADFSLEGEHGELFLSREGNRNYAQFKVVKNGEILSELQYERPRGIPQDPKLSDNRGVEGWNNILTIPYSNTDCGASLKKIFLAWNGSDIHYIGYSRKGEPLLKGEEREIQPGVELIFPKDEKGEKGKILRVKVQPIRESGFIFESDGVIQWSDKGFVTSE